MAFLDFIPLLGAGVGALGSLFGQNQGNKAALKQVELQNKGNMQLAEYAFDRNLDMWERQNAYNTPAEQMQRLVDAGLNPNLMYGQGTTGNASGAPEFNAPNMAAYTSFGDMGASAAGQQLMNGINSYANIQKTQAETNQIRQNTVNMETQNRLAELQIIGQGIANSKSKMERDNWLDLFMAKMSNIDSSTMANFSSAQKNDSERFYIDAQKERFSLLTPYVEQSSKLEIQSKLFELNSEKPAKVRALIATAGYQEKLANLIEKRSQLLEYDLEFAGEANKYVSERAINENLLRRYQVEYNQAETEFRTFLREKGFDIGKYLLDGVSKFTSLAPSVSTSTINY